MLKGSRLACLSMARLFYFHRSPTMSRLDVLFLHLWPNVFCPVFVIRTNLDMAHMSSYVERFHATVYISCPPIQREREKLTQLEDTVREEVGKVQDPETGMTFAEMQMITHVKEEETGVVKIEFIPTSPFCPIAFKLANDIKNAAKKVPGVTKALVYCRGHMMEQQINEMTNK
jgi:metal-sulfur cluster biosynthetic enzyme